MNSKDDMSNNLRYIIWDFFIYNRLLIYYVIDINLHWFYNFTCSSLQIDSANRYFEKEPKLHHYVQLAKHFVEAGKHVVQVAREFSYQLVATPALKKDVDCGFYMLKHVSALNVPKDWIHIEFKVFFFWKSDFWVSKYN